MMLASVTLLILAGQHFGATISLHVPERLPPSLMGNRPVESYLGDTSVGDYREVDTKFLIETPAIPLCRRLASELTKWHIGPNATDADYITRRGASGYLDLPDRRMFIRVDLGREVVREIDRGFVHTFEDADRFATVLVREVPLLGGPAPARWPTDARVPVKVPADIPAMPLKSLSGKPDSIRSSMETGGQISHLTWIIREAGKTAFPRLAEELRQVGGWRVPTEKSEWTCRPVEEEPWPYKDKGPRLHTIQFGEVDRHPGWSSVTVTVYDPFG